MYSITPLSNLPGTFNSAMDTVILYQALGPEATATLVISDYQSQCSLYKQLHSLLDNVNMYSYDIHWSNYRAGENHEVSFSIDTHQGPAALTVINEIDGSDAIYLERIEYHVSETFQYFAC